MVTFLFRPGYIARRKMNQDIAYARITESGCK